MEFRTSVRSLVEFYLRSGDIDTRKGASSGEEIMLEGARIHRKIQRLMGKDYEAEKELRYEYSCDGYSLLLEGRADGVIIGPSVQPLLFEQGLLPEDLSLQIPIIDEIKTIAGDVNRRKEPVPEHLAQAKCYAAMFLISSETEFPCISVRMTYASRENEEMRYFYYLYQRDEILAWFDDLLAEWKKWTDMELEWEKKMRRSALTVPFPYEYRNGQKKLIGAVYKTITEEKKLFIEAPTGVGKTLATVFPAVRAMGEGKADKLFYLTAKTITRTVAVDTLKLLREQGLQMKTVVITAKEKACFQEETECNPMACPYAKGHYDRINTALFDILTHETEYDQETVARYAEKHEVCPFEMALDISLFSDAVICDYNYLFDPHVYLRRYFAEGVKRPYLFLVDESHNLLERGREMYSATLRKEAFLELKQKVKLFDKTLGTLLERTSRKMLPFKKAWDGPMIIPCEYSAFDTENEAEYLRPALDAGIREGHMEELYMTLSKLSQRMQEFLDNHDDSPLRREVLDVSFEIAHFLMMYEQMDDHYMVVTDYGKGGDFYVTLRCVDPSRKLQHCMEMGKATILFSATMLPIQYYKKLLGGEEEDYEIYAQSVFDPTRLKVLVGRDVTSRYSRRGTEEYRRIASYIKEVSTAKQGNYMIFFPSYSMLQQVYQIYAEEFLNEELESCIYQKVGMAEEEREQFLAHFTTDNNKTLLGFCVMGGIFGEGIDLKKNALIGAVIVGTGIPQVGTEREMMRTYFDKNGEDGYDYAYRIPGMNKVLQAAGRVIRTSDDLGVVVLLDERFEWAANKRMFPREWKDLCSVTLEYALEECDMFWKSWNN